MCQQTNVTQQTFSTQEIAYSTFFTTGTIRPLVDCFWLLNTRTSEALQPSLSFSLANLLRISHNEVSSSANELRAQAYQLQVPFRSSLQQRIQKQAASLPVLDGTSLSNLQLLSLMYLSSYQRFKRVSSVYYKNRSLAAPYIGIRNVSDIELASIGLQKSDLPITSGERWRPPKAKLRAPNDADEESTSETPIEPQDGGERSKR